MHVTVKDALSVRPVHGRYISALVDVGTWRYISNFYVSNTGLNLFSTPRLPPIFGHLSPVQGFGVGGCGSKVPVSLNQMKSLGRFYSWWQTTYRNALKLILLSSITFGHLETGIQETFAVISFNTFPRPLDLKKNSVRGTTRYRFALKKCRNPGTSKIQLLEPRGEP